MPRVIKEAAIQIPAEWAARLGVLSLDDLAGLFDSVLRMMADAGVKPGDVIRVTVERRA